MTIRMRLALTYGAAVLVTVAVLGLVVWGQFAIALRTALEQRMDTRAAAVASSIENQGQVGLQDSGGDGGLFVVLLALDGAILDSSANAPPPSSLQLSAVPTQEVVAAGRRYLVRSQQTPDGLSIIVGGDLAPILQSQGTLAGLLVAAAAVAAVASAAGGWWLAGRALKPVASITAEAAAIGPDDLDRRLPEPARTDELGVLARTLNGMLERIGESVRRQQSFIAAASHDLRTPLAALLTELELADRPDASVDELRAAIRGARDDGRRLGDLAADLLALAEVSSTGRKLAITEVGLDDVVSAVLRHVAPIADRANVHLSRTYLGRVARFDRTRVEQALTNLIVNAVTYSPPGADVEVRSAVEAGGGRIVIDVLDRGTGVPGEDREAIFEPFRRGTASRGEGAGLGLATARAAAEAHGGTVTAADRPGGGSVFSLRIPQPAG